MRSPKNTLPPRDCGAALWSEEAVWRIKRVVLQKEDVFGIVCFKWGQIPRGHMFSHSPTLQLLQASHHNSESYLRLGEYRFWFWKPPHLHRGPRCFRMLHLADELARDFGLVGVETMCFKLCTATLLCVSCVYLGQQHCEVIFCVSRFPELWLSWESSAQRERERRLRLTFIGVLETRMEQ